MYYGWSHSSDGTATATKWITAVWLPIVPLKRHRLRVLTDFDENNIESSAGGLIISQVDTYRLLGTLSLSSREVIGTYLKTFVGLPLLWIGPILIASLVAGLLIQMRILPPNEPPVALLMTGSLLGFSLFMINAIRAIRKARGWQRRT